jgi:hypothetical protein
MRLQLHFGYNCILDDVSMSNSNIVFANNYEKEFVECY